MKKQNKTVGFLVQGTAVLRELVEMGSLEVATGHQENKHTATLGETRQGEISKVLRQVERPHPTQDTQ